MDEYLFRPMQTLRRLEELQRRVQHAEAILRAARWEVERVQRGEASLAEVIAMLDSQPVPVPPVTAE